MSCDYRRCCCTELTWSRRYLSPQLQAWLLGIKLVFCQVLWYVSISRTGVFPKGIAASWALWPSGMSGIAKLPPLASCFAVFQEADTCSFLGKLYTTEFRVEELLYTLKVLFRDTIAEDWKTLAKHRLNQSFDIIRTSETLLLYAQNLHKYGLIRNGK